MQLFPGPKSRIRQEPSVYESKGHNVSLKMKSFFSYGQGTWEFGVVWFDKSVPSKLLIGYKEIGIGSSITA